MEVFVILVMLTLCKRGQDGGIRHTGYVDCLLARSGWRYIVILVMLTVCWRGQDGGVRGSAVETWKNLQSVVLTETLENGLVSGRC